MSDRHGLFLFLPGIVAGLVLAAVALEVWSVAFPDGFEVFFPPHTSLFFAAAIATTSVVGLLNLLFTSRQNDSRTQNDVRDAKRIGFPPGGTRVR